MKNNEIFSIIRLGTYALYEKSIVGVDIDCCNEYKLHIPEHTRSLSGSLLGYKTIP